MAESEIPAFGLGQAVEAKLLAYPDRIVEGKVSVLGARVDLATRRLLVRSEIKVPEHLLRPGMFARFVIRTGKSFHSPAIPRDGKTAWINTDDGVFTRRTVRTGLQQNGYSRP